MISRNGPIQMGPWGQSSDSQVLFIFTEKVRSDPKGCPLHSLHSLHFQYCFAKVGLEGIIKLLIGRDIAKFLP